MPVPDRLEMQTAAFVTVTFAVVIVVAVLSFAPVSQGATYTVNGLTCPVPNEYISFKAADRLIPIVTKQPQFLILADGLPYEFGNADNITNNFLQTNNGPVQHLPDAVEMVFYTWGTSTYCDETGGFINPWLSTIVVQVPVQGNGFNLTGATYNAGGGPV